MGSVGSRDKTMAQWPPADNQYPLATFAGGCFWGVELAFQRVPGVVKTCVGYTQGHKDSPTYQEVCSGSTGHTEAVEMIYNPAEVQFDELCKTFFGRINPRQKNGQGNDHGSQYRTGIYYHNDEQKQVAEKWVAATPGCVVEVKPAQHFWPAENYHQQYLEKGGRNGNSQCAAKGCNDPIRCYG